MSHLYKTLVSVAVFVALTAGIANSGLNNGGFEVIDEPSRSELFATPAQWEIFNYVAVVDHFSPTPQSRQESSTNWSPDILANGLYPSAGNSFVLLSTGDVGTDSNTEQAWTSQEFQASAYETIYGNFFFGTFDFAPYYDYATIDLVHQDDPNDSIPLVIVGLDTGNIAGSEIYPTHLDVGTYGSTQGWQYFQYTFTKETAGNYQLLINIYDISDNIYRSYIAIDSLNVCIRPEYGDINLDCKVNLIDFTIMAEDWLCDCSNPADLPDPNDCSWTQLPDGEIKVNLPGDINDDKAVDYLDLKMISEKWMWCP